MRVLYSTTYQRARLNPGMAQSLAGQRDKAAVTLEAEKHFRKAIGLQPGLIAAHKNLVIALADQGRVGEAVRHLEGGRCGGGLGFGRG